VRFRTTRMGIKANSVATNAELIDRGSVRERGGYMGSANKYF